MSKNIQVATPEQNGLSLVGMQSEFNAKMEAMMQAIAAMGGNAPQVAAPATTQAPANNRSRGASPDKQVAAQTRKLQTARVGTIDPTALRSKVLAHVPETKETETQPGVTATIGGRKYNLRPFATCSKDKDGKYTIPTGRTSVSINGGKSITLESLMLYTSDEFRELADAYVQSFGHLHAIEE